MGNYVIVDGNLILHKSFHIYKDLSTVVDGEKVWTGITYGVLHTIVRMVKIYNPCHVAIVFDSLLPSIVKTGTPFVAVLSHRGEIFPDYKKGRHEPAFALVNGFKQLCMFLRHMNISVAFSSPVWEADDVIAFLVHHCAKTHSGSKTKIVVVSDDKDFFQLIRNNKRYSITVHCRGDNIINVKTFEKRFGFVPKNHTDYLALVGDSTDNIPGVSGIGPKTATALLKGNKYILPQDLVEKIKPSEIESYFKNRSLVTLNYKSNSIGGTASCKLDMVKLNLLFIKYHMASFLRESEQRVFRRMKPLHWMDLGDNMK